MHYKLIRDIQAKELSSISDNLDVDGDCCNGPLLDSMGKMPPYPYSDIHLCDGIPRRTYTLLSLIKPTIHNSKVKCTAPTRQTRKRLRRKYYK